MSGPSDHEPSGPALRARDARRALQREFNRALGESETLGDMQHEFARRLNMIDNQELAERMAENLIEAYGEPSPRMPVGRVPEWRTTPEGIRYTEQTTPSREWFRLEDELLRTPDEELLDELLGTNQREEREDMESSTAATWSFEPSATSGTSYTLTAATKAELIKEDTPPHSQLNYITEMAARRGIEVTPEFLALFTGVGDKNLINKLVMEYVKPPEVPLDIQLDGVQKMLQDRYAAQRRQEIHSTKGALDEVTISLGRAFVNAATYSRDMLMYQEKLLGLENKTFDAKAAVHKILENPFYKYIGYLNTDPRRGPVMSFCTQPVILNYKNKEQSIDISVNLGQYLIEWLLNANMFKVLPYKNNTEISHYVHPHVSSGNVCFGNAGNNYSTAIKNMDYAGALNIIQAILHSYNPESPYARIDEFYTVQNKELIAKLPWEYRKVGRMWLSQDEAPCSFKEEIDHGDDDQVQVYVYAKVNIRYGVRLDECYYFLSGNNKYILDEVGNDIEGLR